jgi:hypothetical protein
MFKKGLIFKSLISKWAQYLQKFLLHFYDIGKNSVQQLFAKNSIIICTAVVCKK